jgi:hypothetical protein
MNTLRDRRQLAGVLEKELGFYRKLFVLLDRQRDHLRSHQDDALPGDITTVGEICGRIEESERLVTETRLGHAELFAGWMQTPEIEELTSKIREIAGRCQETATACERMAGERLEEYKAALGHMGRGRSLLASMAAPPDNPRFVDQRP